MDDIELSEVESLGHELDLPAVSATNSLAPAISVSQVEGSQACHVTFWNAAGAGEASDHILEERVEPDNCFVFNPLLNARVDQPDLSHLTNVLASRNLSRTQWIHVVGSSQPVLQEIERLQLNGRSHLTAGVDPDQGFGGPIAISDGREYLWASTPVWLLGQDYKKWSSLHQVALRMIMILPTSNQAGILITCITGEATSLRQADILITDGLIHSHPLRRKALNCTWILAFSLLRTTAEQLECVYGISKFLDTSGKSPLQLQTHDLPDLIGSSRRLRMIDRYLSSLSEIVMFFKSARNALATEYDSKSLQVRRQIIAHAALEVEKAIDKVMSGQRLCQSYIEQTRELVQIVLLYQSTLINRRLDSNNRTGEVLTKLGLAVAAVASVLTPLMFLTSYFGMNVEEFVPETPRTLSDFWMIGIPFVLAAIIPMVFVCIWLYTNRTDARRRAAGIS